MKMKIHSDAVMEHYILTVPFLKSNLPSLVALKATVSSSSQTYYLVRGEERRRAGNWGCTVIMCLVWAALSSVLTCWTINWLMECIWYSMGMVSQEKLGEGGELEVKYKVAQEKSSLQVWM